MMCYIAKSDNLKEEDTYGRLAGAVLISSIFRGLIKE